MAKYFTLDELVRSTEATARGIDNTPSAEAEARLDILAERLLDPLRELWGAPLSVSSGYRCVALNAAVGGAPNSQHLRGEAADITTGSRAGNRRLFELITNYELRITSEAKYSSTERRPSPKAGEVSCEGDNYELQTDAKPSAIEPSRMAEARSRKTKLITKNIEFDQLIDEKNYQWLHISYREGRNRRQILHL